MRLGSSDIVIIGAKGMLGSDIIAALELQNAKVLKLDLPEFDITNSEQVAEAIEGKDVVINCAAYTDVEKAEAEPQKALQINAEAVGRLGEIAKNLGTKVIHISTDFVFDGELDRPYCETDEVNPINVYGQSKLEGERLLLAANPDACVIRVEWTYGVNGNNFASKMIELSKKYSSLKVISDQIGSPTATTEVADAILELANDVPAGIFHYAAKGYASRYDMAKFIFDSLDIKVNLEKCDSSEYKTAAKRPLNSRFDTGKVQGLLKKPIRPWDAVLKEYLEQL